MLYKDEVQKRNEENLQRRFETENVPEFIQRYFVNITSKSGAISYWIAIKNFLFWLMEKGVIKKSIISEIQPEDFYYVESEDITLYLRQKEESGMSPTTLETRKNIFRSFWKYLVRAKRCPVTDDIMADVSYKGISSSGNLIKKLPTEKQLQDMENKIAQKKDEFVRVRNLIILRVLKGSGIREAELAGLNLSDLYLDERVPYIKILGKGKYRVEESRIVYLTGDATKAISEWLQYRTTISNIIDEQAVFLNKRGKRLNEENIKAIFKNYSDGVSPHMLRHWYATVVASKGGVAFAVQQLGHSSRATTINSYVNGVYGMENILKSM